MKMRGGIMASSMYSLLSLLFSSSFLRPFLRPFFVLFSRLMALELYDRSALRLFVGFAKAVDDGCRHFVVRTEEVGAGYVVVASHVV